MIRRTAIPSMLVNFSSFAFLLNFFIHELNKTLKFRVLGHICITSINNQDFYVYQGISL